MAVPHHVRGVTALGGVGVVSATGSVDMVVARPPAHERGVDPALNLDRLGFVLVIDCDRPGLYVRFRSAVEFHLIRSVGQFHGLSIRAIDLRVEVKVGCESLGLRWIYPAELVPNFKSSSGRLTVFIQHFERKIVCWLAVEKQTDFVAETQVLSALADIETQLAIALAWIPAE